MIQGILPSQTNTFKTRNVFKKDKRRWIKKGKKI